MIYLYSDTLDMTDQSRFSNGIIKNHVKKTGLVINIHDREIVM